MATEKIRRPPKHKNPLKGYQPKRSGLSEESKAKQAAARAARAAAREEGKIRRAAREAAGYTAGGIRGGKDAPAITEKQKRKAEKYEEEFKKRYAEDEYFRKEWEEAKTSEQRKATITKSKFQAVLDILQEKKKLDSESVYNMLIDFEADNYIISNEIQVPVEMIANQIIDYYERKQLMIESEEDWDA